jgi:hypothetical protein
VSRQFCFLISLTTSNIVREILNNSAFLLHYALLTQPTPQIELQKQIDSLSRELALMSSSWYELQGKLHNTNNVPISRYRHGSAGLVDAQKGWLARQRSAVAGR